MGGRIEIAVQQRTRQRTCYRYLSGCFRRNRANLERLLRKRGASKGEEKQERNRTHANQFNVPHGSGLDPNGTWGDTEGTPLSRSLCRKREKANQSGWLAFSYVMPAIT